MPYFIEKTVEGWNTVKSDGTVLGKHKNKQDAIKQMVAVSIAEKIQPGGELKRAVPEGSYQPPQGVADAAKRALKWIEEGKAGQGFTAIGRRRASQLASGAEVSADVVNRMLSYFARHSVDRKATGFNDGEDGFPSAGRVAWDAWGGDAGESWVNSLDSRLNRRAVGSIGVSDFDDTLFVAGDLNEQVASWIKSQDVPLFIVTGRLDADREFVSSWLDEHGVEFEQLITRPETETDSSLWKGEVAKKLLAEGNTIDFVVENNVEARAEYEKAGVTVVYDPKNLPVEDSVRDVGMEGVPLTKDELLGKLNDLQGEVLELVGHLVEVVGDLNDLVEATDVVAPASEPAPVDEVPVEDASTRFVEPNKVAELHERGERVSKGIERRQIVRDLEIRQEGDGMTLRGYAAVFNSPSQPLPFTETIEPGAFRDSLKSRNDIKLLWNHDTGTVLGSTRAGTLKLTEDLHGLLVEAQLPDTQAGRDAATLIKRGDVNAFSFGFRVPVGGDEWPSASERVLKRVNVHEVSLVAFPAYLATEGSATIRNMSELANKIVALAEKRGVSAEELTDALLALESGDELTERQGELLTETLSKVLKKDDKVSNPQDLLDLKKKQLDLLMKKV
jgi:HK97 family phage prohead protease